MDYQVVHTITGRCRIRIPQIASDSEYASKLNWLIESLNFVTHVRLNAAASSVIVSYEVDIVSSAVAQEEVFTCIQQASIVEIPELTAVETEPIDRPQVNERQDLGLPFISLVLALLAAPLELPPLMIGGAIALAALPWFTRASESIVTNKHLNIDFLDSLWMAGHTLNGQFIAPALKTSLVETRRTLRGMNADSRECQALEVLNSLDQSALVERDGLTRQLPLKELQSGDRVFVYSGDLIPVDGRILDGTALIDTSNLTGESMPVAASKGEDVYAFSLVLEGKLCILANRTGRNTRIGLIAHLMQAAPVYDTQIGVYQEELVKNAVVPTLCLGVTIFALTGAYSAAIAPFQLDFGSGIQISMPTTILAALTYAARNGVYIRSGRVLEALAQIDTVIVDYTGTLTTDFHPESPSAIATLLNQGINTYVFSDDYQRVATPVADKLGINPNNISGLASPEIKVAVVHGLQKQGKTVAVVGDRINDATILAQADVSVVFAKENDLAWEAADVVLLENDLRGLSEAIDIAKQAMEIVYQNTATIVIPNLVVVAGGVFFGLNPVVNVITNNFSAAIAEFLNSSRPPFGTGALSQQTLTATLPSTPLTSSTVPTLTNAVKPDIKQESPSLCG